MADKKIRKLRQVLTAFRSEIWAILPEKFEEIQAFLRSQESGFTFTEDQLMAAFGDPSSAIDDEKPEIIDGVQVINVDGTLAPRMNLMMRYSGGTSTENLRHQIREANDNGRVKTIILRCDSPGGAASFTAEVATAIRQAEKRIVTSATNMMASACYWIGASADEVFASESTQVGSVGTFMALRSEHRANKERGHDWTVFRAGALKAAGMSVEEWSDEQIASLQKRIDDFQETFASSVAKSRDISIAEVNERFGQGTVFLAEEARRRGMIDGVMTFEEVLAREREKLADRSTMSIQKMEEGMKISAKVKSAMFAASLIPSADASDSDCEISARAWCLAKGNQFEAMEESDFIKSLFDVSPSSVNEKPTPKPEASDGPVDINAIKQQAIVEESNRQAEIRSRAKILGDQVTDEMIESAIADPTISADAAARLWFKTMENAQPSTGTINPGASQVDKFNAIAGEILARRCGMRSDEAVIRQAGSMQNMRTVDLAREALRQQGSDRDVNMLDDEAVAEAFIRAGATAHDRQILMEGGTTNRRGDSPHLVDAFMNKHMFPAYQIADTLFDRWAYRLDDLPDFRLQSFVETGIFDQLDLIKEGEATQELRFESSLKSYYQAERYGNKVGLTVEMVVDERLNGFGMQLNSLVNTPRYTINSHCLSLLASNPLLLDGVAIFDASRGNAEIPGGNVVTPGGAPSAAQAEAMRTRHRLMRGYTNHALDIPPTRTLVPATHETKALQTFFQGRNDSKVAQTDDNINTVRGTMEVLVDARLDKYSTREWYTFADPGSLPVIAYAYMRGYGSGGRRTTWFDPDTKSRFISLEARFAVAPVGYRGAVKNIGT